MSFPNKYGPYADTVGKTTPPYKDDLQEWKNTLKAFERHFESNGLGHYFLRRIDIITMQQLIEARKNVLPLTQKELNYFQERIENSIYAKKKEYVEYNKSVIAAYDELKKVFQIYSRE